MTSLCDTATDGRYPGPSLSSEGHIQLFPVKPGNSEAPVFYQLLATTRIDSRKRGVVLFMGRDIGPRILQSSSSGIEKIHTNMSQRRIALLRFGGYGTKTDHEPYRFMHYVLINLMSLSEAIISL
jgi:hypothetical protein